MCFRPDPGIRAPGHTEDGPQPQFVLKTKGMEEQPLSWLEKNLPRML